MQVAVVEAGLGGRYDATNVIPSRVQVLTNVGLEHTRWLGPTVADIAREKLDVVQADGILVVGDDLHPDALALARDTCAERGARLVVTAVDSLPATLEVLARGPYQRRNFALARAAAEAYLGALDEGMVAAAAASTLVPGRFEVVDSRAGHRARRRPQPGRAWPRWPRRCAASSTAGAWWPASRSSTTRTPPAMLRELLPLCDEVICTASANPRALSPGTLQSLCGQLGGPPARTDARPAPGARGGPRRRRARRRRAGHRHHLPDRRSAAARGRRAPEHAMNDDGPSVPAMIAAVAVIVALVILVFFALGYGFGRLFL